MAKAKPINPPFAWLGRFWVPVALGLVILTAAFFRFYRLDTLPPGLDETSARIGLDSLNLSLSHWLPAFDSANGYAPLWVWLQALAIAAFGHTALALRIWPALLGTIAVAAVWLWLRDWFGKRVAWVGALALAVSPWAVTIARNGLPSALLPLEVAATLWLGGRAWRSGRKIDYVRLGLILAADALSGPLGWLLAGAVLVLAALNLIRRRELSLSPARSLGLGIFAVGLIVLAYQLGTSGAALSRLPHALGLATSLSDILHNVVRVLLMFNLHGDENYRHNLSGEPMLNAFIGLMAVTGLLVAISRAHQLRYRLLLILTFVMLIPATLTTVGVPNSSWAVGALPLVFGLVGIGTSYMLELWYATFPINSAARATGQAAIIVLLALTLAQGYTQYFRAWAGSTAVYAAYNEGSTLIAKHVRADKFDGERYVVVPANEQSVISYLDYGQKNFQILSPAQLTALPLATASRRFYIGAASRDEAVKIMKAKFPGGILQPHYSDFNLVEVYYTYEVAK